MVIMDCFITKGKGIVITSILSLFLWVPNLLAVGFTTIQNGSTITIHYSLTVEGKVVESSVGKKPFTYIQGKSQIFPALEEQLKGLKRGDKKHVTITQEKGYGQVDPDAYQTVPRKSFKNYKTFKVGTTVTGQFNGKPINATIIAIDGKNFILDLNHPWAGKTLQYDVEVVDIKSNP